jgi:hypothetical protein
MAFVVYWPILSTPEETLKIFYSNELAEDQLTNHLIVGGKQMVPLLLKEVENKSMKGRLYAVEALGHLSDKSALPTLEGILKDVSELEGFRCVALEAITLIAPDVGRNFAKENMESPIGCLRQLSVSIMAGKLPKRKTYLQARLGLDWD